MRVQHPINAGARVKAAQLALDQRGTGEGGRFCHNGDSGDRCNLLQAGATRILSTESVDKFADKPNPDAESLRNPRAPLNCLFFVQLLSPLILNEKFSDTDNGLNLNEDS
ncbi:hypothetical protein [Paracoccus pacificus]|uniref:Uncharacterized protein n=1 Tax=Paracoccus pacificus TaxID=1463598 RepID=A0ABW4R919_9RHOB